jgi:lysophospholipase L1-like esterase
MPSGKAIRGLFAFLLAGTLMWTLPEAAHPAETGASPAETPPPAAIGADAPDAYRIVVLGDSIGVGYEPGAAAESDLYGYADRLYEQALLRGRAELANYAILGLRTEGLIRQLQGAAERKSLPASALQDFSAYGDPRISRQAETVAAKGPELLADLAAADLVAITIGGNDFLGFIRGVLAMPAEEAEQTLKADIETILNNYAEHAETAVRLVHALAPNASIELSDQYLPFPRQTNADLYDLLTGSVGQLSADLDALAAKLQAEGIPLRIVHIGSAFAGYELSMTHMFADQDVHPNQNGYNAIAEAFAKTAWNAYVKLVPADRGTAASPAAPAIYVDGKPLVTAYKPKLRGGATFLPLRDIADATGAQVSWDGKTKTALFRKNGREVAIAIGSKTLRVDGAEKPLAAPAYLEKAGSERKTYVPLAAIASGLDCQVVYRPKLYTVFIHS